MKAHIGKDGRRKRWYVFSQVEREGMTFRTKEGPMTKSEARKLKEAKKKGAA